MNKWFHHALSSAALTLPAGFWFTEYMYSIVKVRGSSMEPALKDGDMILVRKTDFFPNYSISSESDDEKDLARSEKLELINSGYNAGIISSPPMVFQGHVVVFASPKTAFPKEYHVKRVTGIGGQMLRPRSRFQRFEQIPPHHIWVEGDNAGDSEDSNHHGPISKKLMIGKAERIVWPPSRWNSIERVKPMAGKAWWP